MNVYPGNEWCWTFCTGLMVLYIFVMEYCTFNPVRGTLLKTRHYTTSLLSARPAMWSMPVVLTETENENDSATQNDTAKMTLQK